jgi:hypothetical protein
MTELQEARAKWLDAETRVIESQLAIQRLTVANCELQTKLCCAQGEAEIMKAMQQGFVAGLIGICW